MSYNIEELKKKINSLSSNQKQDKIKVTWWKPQIGNHDIRFIPLTDSTGEPLSQPFHEVAYYDNEELSERRFVAPSQYGLPDPLKEVALELAPDKSREGWLMRKKLTPRERYYAAVLVRGEEEKGAQVWEISPKICKDIYGLLVMPDYADEDLLSVDAGFDFTVSVSATDKKFKDYVVKEIKLVPRRKPSKLLPKKEQVDELLKQVPNLEAYFKAQVKSEDELCNIRDNFLASQEDSSEHAEVTKDGTIRGGGTMSEAAVASMDAAFADVE